MAKQERPEDAIRAVVDAQVKAIRARDADAVMATYADDTRSFDVVPPLANRGRATIRQRLDKWFAAYEGVIGCDMHDLEIVAQDELAFCHGFERFTGTMTSGTKVDMVVRVTKCFRNVGGKWLVVHEHMSDPFDPDTGKARTDLKPE